MTTSIQGPTAVSPVWSKAIRQGSWPGPTRMSVSPFRGCRSPLERILPSARGAGGGRRLEVVEQHLAVVVARSRHRVPLRHPVERIVPALAGLALLRDDLEPMARGAGIERLLAPIGRRIVLRALVARREGRSLCRGGFCRERQRNRREGTQGARPHHAMRIATRCIGLAP